MATSERERAIREAATVASMFTVKPDRSIHSDIAWDEMSKNAQIVAHTTAQQISWAILKLLEK